MVAGSDDVECAAGVRPDSKLAHIATLMTTRLSRCRAYAIRLAFAAATFSQTIVAQPLTLGDAARRAARDNAAVAVAALRADQADARVTQRRADLLPLITSGLTQADRSFNTATLGLQVDLPGANRPLFDPRGEVLGPVPTVDLRARVQQSLVDPAAWARLKAARAVATVADAETGAQSEAAALTAATAYLRVLRAEATVLARRADSALAADLRRIAQDQLTAGIGIALDVTRADAQVASVQAQRIAAHADRERARIELRRALMLGVDASIAIADSLGAHIDDPSPQPDDAANEALRSRPELRVLQTQQLATLQQQRATRAERLPTLGMVADRGVIGRDYSRLLSTWTWGVQLSLPAFDGFRREGRIAEQRSQSRELDIRVRELKAQIDADVRMALLDLTSAREQTTAARERLRLAEQEVAQARDRFSGGVTGNADVITASLALTAARTQLIDVLTQFQVARVSLARAQGSLTRLP
jgi:outer membrane protein